jgi:hypothetical protein
LAATAPYFCCTGSFQTGAIHGKSAQRAALAAILPAWEDSLARRRRGADSARAIDYSYLDEAAEAVLNTADAASDLSGFFSFTMEVYNVQRQRLT